MTTIPTDASNNIDEEHNYPAEEEKKVNSDAMLQVHSTAKSNDPNLSGKVVFLCAITNRIKIRGMFVSSSIRVLSILIFRTT